MFSTTLRFSQSISSWYTVEMPSESAACGSPGAMGLPLKSISPSSAGYQPDRIFIRVDLPAPFSPATVWISPAATEKLTPSRARTPGKLFEMPRKTRISCTAISSGTTCPGPRRR